jgi:hypothetical protein
MKISKIVFALVLLPVVGLAAPKPPKPQPPLKLGADGRLEYKADSLGNRIPDFSYAGYMAGEKAIPMATVKVVVPCQKGDATTRIQAAINYVASLPADKDGLRGAVLLEKGTYEVSGQIKIQVSGVVLRGSGMGEGGTILVGTGIDRQSLIRIVGKTDTITSSRVALSDAYVPVNAMSFKVKDASGLNAGDRIRIVRPCTWAWIRALGTEHFGGGVTALGWKPGDRDLVWDRVVTAVSGNTVTIDAPLTTAIDTAMGGGYVVKYTWAGRIAQIGVENLQLQSTFDVLNPKDENHRWVAVTFENAQDCWVRQVVFQHFAGSAVAVWESVKRVTIEDCKSLAPVSEIGNQRRNSFWITGQQVLCQRLYAENGYHDFVTGLMANLVAFVQCQAVLPYSYCGGNDSWSSGILFDVVYVDGNAISFRNLGQDKQGAGWNVANGVFWNCSASRIDCFAPPTAQNWSFGTWAQFMGDGSWWDSNNSIDPRSLYYKQLSERTGFKVLAGMQYMDVETDASSSPKVEEALAWVKKAEKPLQQLKEFIDLAPQRTPVSTDAKGAKTIDQIGFKTPEAPIMAAPMHIQNGWVVRADNVVIGNKHNGPWWKGTVRPNFIEKEAEPAITAFVPGRIGTGLTDDLDSVTNWMVRNHILSFDYNYGLWYDRRRDDHERIRRMDGEVWPPFYQQPFARSGKELAWDGLSKYDLTKYDAWYWLRLKQFADFADQKGLVLIHQNFFQHNIIEAGAHWVDCPWRTANNINNTGFPEPVPFAGDKRLFMAEQFYDITQMHRNELQKAYIRQCLNNFSDNSGVIQLISAEYTGPFHFVKFWLQTIKEWGKETGKHQIIGLSTTKDVQDSILADPEVSGVVDLIDIRYWSYRSDSTLFAPKGGLSLAPRQHMRLIKTGKRSFEMVYKEVREYRSKFPGKAVMYSNDSYDQLGWAIFMAGGSLANLPAISHSRFLADASTMLPVTLPGQTVGQYILGNPETGFIVYNDSPSEVKVDLTNVKGSFKTRYINPRTGQISKEEVSVKSGGVANLKASEAGYSVVWLSRK